jgi:DNA-binding MarR family transcriptional regulator
MFELWQFAPYLLNRAGHRIAEVFSGVLDQFDLTLPMWRVMAALRSDGPQRLGELSRLATIEVSTLSRLVGQMQGRGLLRRERCGRDARAVNVALTVQGEAITDRIIPLALDCERMALRGMSEAEVALLKRLLLHVYENMADQEVDYLSLQ